MREILFKAKRKNWRELPKEKWWIEGYLFDDGMVHPEHYFVGYITIEPYRGIADDGWSITGTYLYEIDPETLCQYTGLKDKNGNKIWENDICVLHTNSIDEEDGYFKVEYDEDNARFVFLGVALQFDFEFLRDDECEVVGTIFEHPELQEYLRRYP